MFHQARLTITASVLIAGIVFASLPSQAAALPTVTPADAAVLHRAVANNKGKVVLVNFWATWCGPCVAEFPSIVRLDQAYRSKGLAVMTVSVDLPDQVQSGVKPFLAKQKATFPQFIVAGGDPSEVINAFDPKWQGGVPRTFVYDRSGRLVKTFDGEETYAEFEAVVKPLLLKPVRRAAL